MLRKIPLPPRPTLVLWTAIFGILLVLLLKFPVLPQPSRPPRPVNIATSEWAPYVTETAPNDGPMAEILRLVLNRQGLEPNIQYSTWDAALQNVESGQALAAFPMVLGEEREDGFTHTEPIYSFTYRLFYDGTRPPLTLSNPETLKSLTVGTIDGYYYWREVDELIEHNITYPTTHEAFIALAEGTVDIVIEGEDVGIAELLSPSFPYDASRFQIVEEEHPWTTSERGLHLFLQQGEQTESFIEQFNSHLAEVKNTREYTSIIENLSPFDNGYQVSVRAPQGTMRCSRQKRPHRHRYQSQTEHGSMFSSGPRSVAVTKR